jgi:hypothetical protein
VLEFHSSLYKISSSEDINVFHLSGHHQHSCTDAKDSELVEQFIKVNWVTITQEQIRQLPEVQGAKLFKVLQSIGSGLL